MPKKVVIAATLALAIVGAAGWYAYQVMYGATRAIAQAVVAPEPERPIIKFGLNLADFKVLNHVVKQNEFFADILSQYNVTYPTVDLLARAGKEIFNFNHIRAGSNCTVLYDKKDSTQTPKKLIYEENKVDYVVFNLDDSLYIYRGQNKVERKHQEVSGIINSSLYETFEQQHLSTELAIRMSEIFAWTVDFYRIQPGDKFKVIYDEDFVNGESVGLGEVSACVFNSSGKDFYAFYYAPDKTHEGGYYDENGNTMKKQFLKAPVKFSRISSPYSLNRFHPVTKEWKAHLGTDYAAPFGTPIMATADGVVENAEFGVYNGNFVKIRHNGQYKTQYLHMSKIANGIHPGVRVKQGQTIGYVGATGLATGPHCCYRFWKDGAQVDPLKQKLTYSDPMPVKYKPDFMAKTKGTKKQLDALAYNQAPSNPTPPLASNDDTAYAFVKKFF